MFKCLGKYGSWSQYEIDLGESETTEGLLSSVINRMNCLKSKEMIKFYVLEENEIVGRFMRVDYEGYELQYVPKEEISQFVKNKRKRFGFS